MIAAARPIQSILFVVVILSAIRLDASVAAAETSSAGVAMDRAAQKRILRDALAAFDRGAELQNAKPQAAADTFAEAADGFQMLIDAGARNGAMYYNLGNAQLKAGRHGQAIASYRRALRDRPTDARLIENLRYARLLCGTEHTETAGRRLAQTLLFWHFDTSLRSRAMLAIGAYIAFWLLLTFRSWQRRVPLAIPAVCCLVLWLAAGTSAVYQTVQEREHPAGVITADNVVARKGDGEGYEPQFVETLSEGVEFDVVEQRQAWLLIRLPDGKQGWVRRQQVELI